MKTRLTGLLMLVSTLSMAQRFFTDHNVPPERRLILGIDLMKTILAAPGGPGNDYPFKKESFVTLEPTLRIGMVNPRFLWVLQPGFTRATGIALGNTRLTMTGGFLKAGIEYRAGAADGIALLLTAASWQTAGTLTLPGGAFAPYATPVPTTVGYAGGLEVQASRDFPLGPSSAFRFLFRANGFWRSRYEDAPKTTYIPGLGRYIDFPKTELSITTGFTIEFHQYLRGRW